METINRDLLTLTSRKDRFALEHEYVEGCFRQDKHSQHWTTYAVPAMNRAEVQAAYDRAIAKGGCGVYRIVDLDIEDGLNLISRTIRRALTLETGYDDMSADERRSPKGDEIRALVRSKIARAHELAMMAYITSQA